MRKSKKRNEFTITETEKKQLKREKTRKQAACGVHMLVGEWHASLTARIE